MTSGGSRSWMPDVPVTRVSIDDTERLCVETGKSFDFVYKAATGVEWDPARRALLSPLHRDLTPAARLQLICDAVRSEYGVVLVRNDDTDWSAVPASQQFMLRRLLPVQPR